jgi:hypothetical protein
MEHAKRFAGIFDGLKLAYGTYRIDRAASNGKQQGKAGVVKNPRTPETWEGHLSGKGDAIGIIPINEDNSCKWGCIDIDQYPLDHKELIDRIRKMKLPMVVCRSKSGGAHCFLVYKLTGSLPKKCRILLSILLRPWATADARYFQNK